MSSLPRKSVTGLPLKKYVLDTLNGLIDYLQTHRIQAGRGIDVRETASGYVIGLAKPPSNPPQVQNAGGGTIATAGFPAYSSTATSVSVNTEYYATDPVWLIGYIEQDLSVYASGEVSVSIYGVSGGGSLYSQQYFGAVTLSPANTDQLTEMRFPVCIPVPAGYYYKFERTSTGQTLHVSSFSVT